ncbi:MAG: hypothetical protein QOI22_1791 [Verrucomicrobiota bacterium]
MYGAHHSGFIRLGFSFAQFPFGILRALRNVGRDQRRIDIMTPVQLRSFILGILAIALGHGQSALAQSITRTESLRIAESFIHHRWESSVKNQFHGRDANGIEVNTPDRDSGRGSPSQDCWRVNAENIGIAYKWGGVDTPATFDAGIREGKAAGDVYTLEKRRRGKAGVSQAAVGVDCSGFICRCWKVDTRYSTATLASICQKLPDIAALRPGDIMNQPNGHVVLFVKWLDRDNGRALFYESAPFSKTLASERNVKEMVAAGYVPLRYRQIRD